MEMTRIMACDVTVCAYNKKNGCHTPGITVGPHGECSTFSHASARGGFDVVNAGVGACLAAGCKFNGMLECKAADIEISMHDRHPDCRSYQEKM